MQDIWSLAFSPDGRWLAAAHDDKVVSVWDVAAKKNLTLLRSHTSSVYAVAFSRDGRLLTSAGRDGAALLWTVDRIAAK